MPEIKDEKHKDFYEELRAATAKWFCEHDMEKGADIIFLAPDFFYLLCKLVVDEKVKINEKLKLGLAITYFLSPIDFIPEALLGTFGFIDDVALAAYVLNSILSVTPEAVIRKHWLGKKDILQEIESVLAKVDNVIGRGLWRKIMDCFDNPDDYEDSIKEPKASKKVKKAKTTKNTTPPKLPKKSATKKKKTAIVKDKTTAKKKPAAKTSSKSAKK